MKNVRLKNMGGTGKDTVNRALAAAAPRTYILNAKGKPVLEPDQKPWIEWCSKHDVQSLEKIAENIYAGLIFLTFDDGLSGCIPPPLWQVTIHVGTHYTYKKRLRSLTQARKDLKVAIALLKQGYYL